MWQISTGRNRTVLNSYSWKSFKNLAWNLGTKLKNLGFWLNFSTKHQGAQVNENNTRQDSQAHRSQLRLTGAGFFLAAFHGVTEWLEETLNLFLFQPLRFFAPWQGWVLQPPNTTGICCGMIVLCETCIGFKSVKFLLFCSRRDTKDSTKAPKVLKTPGKLNNLHSTYFSLADVPLWALNDECDPMGSVANCPKRKGRLNQKLSKNLASGFAEQINHQSKHLMIAIRKGARY